MDILSQCPNCGNPLQEKDWRVCPKCKINVLDFLKPYISQAIEIKNNLDRVKESEVFMTSNAEMIDYRINALVKKNHEENIKWLFGYAVVFTAIFGIFGFNTFNDFKDEARKLINDNFQSGPVQKIVRETAKEYTDKNISQNIKDRTDTLIVPIRKELEDKIAESEKKVQLLGQLNEVKRKYFIAKAGSKKAFCDLLNMASSSDDIGREAQVSVKSIVNELDELRIPPAISMDVHVTWKGQTAFLSTMALPDVLEALGSDSPIPLQSFIRLQQFIIDKIANTQDIDLDPLMVKFLKKTDSLIVSASSCIVLKERYNPPFEWYEFDKWVKYLEERQSKSVATSE